MLKQRFRLLIKTTSNLQTQKETVRKKTMRSFEITSSLEKNVYMSIK